VRGEEIFVNLFAGSSTVLEAGGTRFRIVQETDYPWDGMVRFHVHPEHSTRTRILIRVPGWARGEVLGASLSFFGDESAAAPRLSINGAPSGVVLERGYAAIDRVWEDGDVVELALPLPIRRVRCDPRVVENRGRAAVQRGPIVYCVEGRDTPHPLDSLPLPAGDSLAACWWPGLLGGVIALRSRELTAVPYATWANRGAGPMRVWLREG
jgi:hypothetical protein